MTSSYFRIMDIDTLDDVLSYLKNVDKKDKISLWLDWDENIINSDNDTIIEPEVTKRLFNYLLENRIFFSIITGRFYDTVCDDKKRNIFDMQYNITTTMYPILKELGVNVARSSTEEHKRTIYKIYNEEGICVGILYMGIIFSHKKGETIKNYLRQTKFNLPHKIFVDDYEPYLLEVTQSVPDIIAFRRHVPYL